MTSSLHVVFDQNFLALHSDFTVFLNVSLTTHLNNISYSSVTLLVYLGLGEKSNK